MTKYLDYEGLKAFKKEADKTYVRNQKGVITSELYANQSIWGEHVLNGTLFGYHFHPASISSRQLMNKCVTTAHLDNSVYEYISQKVINGAWVPVKAGRNSEGDIIEGAVSEGKETVTNAEYAHAEGLRTVATGMYSHAEGDNTTALNNSSHAEGNNTKANGDCSHAEGYRSVATGNYSHAEGCDTQAISYGSHAEGYQTQASSSYSHSEGYQTKALGFCSHAEGYAVSAKGNYAHCEGIYNYDSNDFIKVLGVGNSDDNRVNAEVVYVKRGENGVPISSDPKNGCKYILGIGGYTGKAITEGMKSIQEVISDLLSRIAILEAKVKS